MTRKITISINELKPGTRAADSIYILSGSNKNMLICRKDTIIDRRMIGLLLQHGIQKLEVYVNENDYKNRRVMNDAEPHEIDEPVVGIYKNDEPNVIYDYAMPKIKPVLDEPLRDCAIESIRKVFTLLDTPDKESNFTRVYRILREFNHILSHVVAAISNDINSIIHIADLKKFDEYTYQHSLSVALLSISAGQVLGLELMELIRLCKAAILHDIGKIFITQDIVQKTERLTDEEFFEMKTHPTLGQLCLKAKGIGDVETWNAIMFHHEKVNGRGYPKGLTGDEIPLFSKIISVADVYDAVTSHRPYRESLTPTAAYDLVCAEIGSSFDYDIVRAVIKRLVLYPINSIIELSDKTIAVVTDNSNLLRPVVELLKNKERIDLSSTKHLKLSITKVLSSSDFSESRGKT